MARLGRLIQSRAATVLPEGDHIGAFKRHGEAIIAQAKLMREKQAAEQANLDKSLIPPDIDTEGMYAQDRKEIADDMDAYQTAAYEYYQQGINHMDPRNAEAYQKMRGLEKNMELKAYTAKNHYKIDEEARKSMGKKDFHELYDVLGGVERLSVARDYGPDNGGIMGREKYYQGIGYNLFDFKEYDFDQYFSDNKWDLTEWDDEPKIKGGSWWWNHNVGYTEDQVDGMSKNFLTDPQTARWVNQRLSGLSERGKLSIMAQAAKNNTTLEEQFLRNEINSRQPVSQTLKSKSVGGKKGGSGGGDKEKDGGEMWLIQQFAAFYNGDDGIYDGTFTNKGGDEYKYSLQPFAFSIGTFSFQENQDSPKTTIKQGALEATVEEGGSGKKWVKHDNYIEAIAHGDDGVWVATTESNTKMSGIKQAVNGGGDMYWNKLTPKQADKLLSKMVQGNSKFSMTKFDAITKGKRDAAGVLDLNYFYWQGVGGGEVSNQEGENNIPSAVAGK